MWSYPRGLTYRRSGTRLTIPSPRSSGYADSNPGTGSSICRLSRERLHAAGIRVACAAVVIDLKEGAIARKYEIELGPRGPQSQLFNGAVLLEFRWRIFLLHSSLTSLQSAIIHI